MVTKWGLSEKLGPLMYSDDQDEVFLGHSVTQTKSVSDETAYAIDKEVRSIIDRNYQRSKDILTAEIDTLHSMAAALMRFETIDADQIKDIMEGKDPRPPKDYSDSTPPSSGDGAAAEETEDSPKTDGIGGPASLH
jgi:cell division protease FtsH